MFKDVELAACLHKNIYSFFAQVAKHIQFASPSPPAVFCVMDDHPRPRPRPRQRPRPPHASSVAHRPFAPAPPGAPAANEGVATAAATGTQTQTLVLPDGVRRPSAALQLRLRRRRHPFRRPSVQWTRDTHDNEHDGKRSSKSCCIFHRRRAFDESETESDDDEKKPKPDDDGDGGGESDSSSGGRPRTNDPTAHVRAKLRELQMLREATANDDESTVD